MNFGAISTKGSLRREKNLSIASPGDAFSSAIHLCREELTLKYQLMELKS